VTSALAARDWCLVRFEAEHDAERLDYYAELERAEMRREAKERNWRATLLPTPASGRLSLADALDRLEKVRKTRKGWSALCPAHEDRNASLLVSESDVRPGEPIFKCFAGCPWTAVLKALKR